MEFEICDEFETSVSFTEHSGISRIPSETSYNEFFRCYMLPNIPCVITNVSSSWNAAKLWVEINKCGNKPNFEYLRGRYGQCQITIYNCSEKYYNSQKTDQNTFDWYLQYWQNKENSQSQSNLLYLKDWHLKLQFERDNFYEVPIYFASDWLNEYHTECLEDDYRFVYMGPKFTWTPFHVDVFTSYSWSTNVCGRKRWHLFPPGEEKHLKNNFNELPYDLTEIEHSRRYLEIIQNPGEAIFVPSGWYHQVWNLEDTISINHNWINGNNIMTMWNAMESCLKKVIKEIDDCKDMDNFHEHCQLMLDASFGMNYQKFYEFVKFITQRRLDMINKKSSCTLFHGHTIGKNHIIFDLCKIKNVLQSFMGCDIILKLINVIELQQLLEDVILLLDK